MTMAEKIKIVKGHDNETLKELLEAYAERAEDPDDGDGELVDNLAVLAKEAARRLDGADSLDAYADWVLDPDDYAPTVLDSLAALAKKEAPRLTAQAAEEKAA